MKVLKIFMLCIIIGLCPALVLATTFEATVDDSGFHHQLYYLNIYKGDSVKWTNTGTTLHSITSGGMFNPLNNHFTPAPDGYFNSGPLTPGGTFVQPFPLIGEFTYFDKYNTAHFDSVRTTGGVSISPGSSELRDGQGFDLMFILNCGGGATQYSIAFDGIEVLSGTLLELVTNPLSETADLNLGTSIMFNVPPHTMPLGIHSLSIEATYGGQVICSDKEWYSVLELVKSMPATLP